MGFSRRHQKSGRQGKPERCLKARIQTSDNDQMWRGCLHTSLGHSRASDTWRTVLSLVPTAHKSQHPQAGSEWARSQARETWATRYLLGLSFPGDRKRKVILDLSIWKDSSKHWMGYDDHKVLCKPLHTVEIYKDPTVSVTYALRHNLRGGSIGPNSPTALPTLVPQAAGQLYHLGQKHNFSVSFVRRISPLSSWPKRKSKKHFSGFWSLVRKLILPRLKVPQKLLETLRGMSGK